MNKYLLKISGLAGLLLLLQTSGFSQSATDKDNDSSARGRNGYDEIIIRHKSDKNTKVTIEMKGDQVYIDGKPLSDYDYNNDDLSIRKLKRRIINDRAFSYSGPDGGNAITITPSPFRSEGGGWSYDGEGTRIKVAPRALLGVTSNNTSEGNGAKIMAVSEGSAAEKTGLKEGDIITRIDEIPVNNPEDLSAAIGKYKPEDKVTVTYKREGKEQKVTATLGKNSARNLYGFTLPRNPEMDLKNFRQLAPDYDFNYNFTYNKSSPRLGIKAQDTEDGKGVKVLDVDDESNAAKAGVKEGDIITRFDGTEINNAETLSRIAAAAKVKPSVHINLLRNGKPMELDIKVPHKLKTTDL